MHEERRECCNWCEGGAGAECDATACVYLRRDAAVVHRGPFASPLPVSGPVPAHDDTGVLLRDALRAAQAPDDDLRVVCGRERDGRCTASQVVSVIDRGSTGHYQRRFPLVAGARRGPSVRPRDVGICVGKRRRLRRESLNSGETCSSESDGSGRLR